MELGARALGGRSEGERTESREAKRMNKGQRRDGKRARGCTRKEACTLSGKMQMALFRMRQGGKLGRAWKRGRTKERCTRSRRGWRARTLASRSFPVGKHEDEIVQVAGRCRRTVYYGRQATGTGQFLGWQERSGEAKRRGKPGKGSSEERAS